MAHYPGNGAGYVRHCDNHCSLGAGSDCNGRRVTAIVYLNPSWAEADGGELLLFRPPPHHDDEWCRIAPRFGSAVLFWSDYRVPHAVKGTLSYLHFIWAVTVPPSPAAAFLMECVGLCAWVCPDSLTPRLATYRCCRATRIATQ